MNSHEHASDTDNPLTTHGLQAHGPVVWFVPPDATMMERLGLSEHRRLSFRLVAALSSTNADSDVFDRNVTTIWNGRAWKNGMTENILRSGGSRALVEPCLQSAMLVHPFVVPIPSGDWNRYAWNQLNQGRIPAGAVNGQSLIGLVQARIDEILQGTERPIEEWPPGKSMELMIHSGNFWVLLSALVAQGVEPTVDESRWIVAYDQDGRPKNQTGYAEMGLRDFLGRPAQMLVAAAERVLLEEDMDRRSAPRDNDPGDLRTTNQSASPNGAVRKARTI